MASETRTTTGGPDHILEIRHLSVDYASDTGTVHAVDDVSFAVERGEVFGLAGESGSGKSTLAFAVARLLKFPARITGGQILFTLPPEPGEVPGMSPPASIDVMDLSPEELRQFRWSKLSIVFQSAMNALNPVISIRAQLTDVIKAHDPHLDARSRDERARELIRMVGISPDRLNSYPHQLSGGMRQRAIIAIALALRPELIIMDEPTTALDVVVQREIINEIKTLQATFGFSVIFITHDLSLLLEISNHVAIMYAGRLVEMADQERLLTEPYHPYTSGLIHSFPELGGQKKRMVGIPGHPPDLRSLPPGCAFAPRCAYAFDTCRRVVPPLQAPEPSTAHMVACHLYDPAYSDGTGIPHESDTTTHADEATSAPHRVAASPTGGQP